MGGFSVGPYVYPHSNFLELSFEKPFSGGGGGNPDLPDGWSYEELWPLSQGVSSAAQSTARVVPDGAYHLRLYARGSSQYTWLRQKINAVPYLGAKVRFQAKAWVNIYLGGSVFFVSDGTGPISFSANPTTGVWINLDSGWQTIPTNATYLQITLRAYSTYSNDIYNDVDAITVTFSLPTPSTRDDPRLAGARGRILEWPFGLASQGYGRGIRGIEPLTLPTPRR